MLRQDKYRRWLITVLFLFLFFFSAKGVEAGFLKFDNAAVDTTVNNTFQLQVLVDTGSDEINSIDAYITYDESMIEAQSVAAGSFFPSIAQNLATGKVYVAGYVDDPATSKTGIGSVATITFKAIKNGTVTLAYFCDTTVNESSKIIKNDINATNVIVCSSNGTSTVTVGGSSTDGTPTSTDSAGTTDTSTTDTSSLPAAGIVENILAISIPGFILLAIGILFKFL